MTTLTTNVVEARVRRALRHKGQVLRKTRPGRTWAKVDFGDYFTADHRTGDPDRRHIDLADLARELRVLHPHERIGK
jgi:hypothetical protein